MLTVYKQFILITLLVLITASCHIFKDIEDKESDGGVENTESEDNEIESLRQEEETDPNQKGDGQKSTDADKPDLKDTYDSDSEDTGKPETIDTDTKEDVTVCKDGELKCEDKCVLNDIYNCGDCGHDCTELLHVGSQVECTNGVCIFSKSSCDNGWAHCSKDPDDGCETNITEAINCGECGKDCTETDKKLCTPEDDGYECAVDCQADAPTQCGSSCVNIDDSTSHCSKCYNECDPFPNSQPVCKDGECGFECDDSEYIECPDGCFPNDDKQHCGTCENDCAKDNKLCDGKGKCVECLKHDDCKGNSAKLCIKNKCKECESGDCCDPDTNFYDSSSKVCKTTTEYQCDGMGCGANAQKRVLMRYCRGDSPYCDGREDESLDIVDYCDNDQRCESDDNSASCVTCKHGCSSGKCWSECNPKDDHCCEADGTIISRYEQKSELCWQHPMASNEYNWEEAKNYCKAFSQDGKDDWRLPSRQEFIDLLGGCDPDVVGGREGYCRTCAESATCTELFGEDTDWYWSSSPVVNDDDAWDAGFGNGRVTRNYVNRDRNVRCVRRDRN